MNKTDKAADTLLYKLRWVMLLVFAATVGLSVAFVDSRVLMRFAIIFGVTIAVGCMAHAFAGAFTKTEWKKWIAVIFIVGGGFFWYYVSQKDTGVVKMKEDVMYIHPKSTLTNPDDIYDGSENDPNLKQDTTK
jgi:hypothetical protein